MTTLDDRHSAMEDAPQDDALRLQFYERLADAEIYLLLVREPEGDALAPQIFETSQGRFVLAFDLAQRLAEFAKGPAPYAALSGRVLASMLEGREIGLALNPGLAPSSTLISPEAVTWLVHTLGNAPAELEDHPVSFYSPRGLPETLLGAIDAKLSTAMGLARMAYLAGVTYRNGARSHILGFVDATPGAERALASAVGEVLTFSRLEAGTLDVTFLKSSDRAVERLDAVGIRFDLPAFAPKPYGKAPGTDPDLPPKLR